MASIWPKPFKSSETDYNVFLPKVKTESSIIDDLKESCFESDMNS